MVELFIRLASALTAAGLAWQFSPDAAPSVFKVSGVFAAYSVLVFLLEKREFRNAGVSGFVAVFDAFSLAVLFGAIDKMDSLGFLVLAPCAYAAARFGSLPTAMAPLAATSLAVSFGMFHPGTEPPTSFYIQLAGVLVVGLLLNHRRIVVTESRPMIVEVPQPESDGPPPEGYMELRESFRKMRDLYRELMAKSRRDRNAVELYEMLHKSGEPLLRSLTAKIRELTGASGAAIYKVSKFEDVMVVQHYDGAVPEAITAESLTVEVGGAKKSVRDYTLSALKSVLDEESRRKVANVPLRIEGRLEGMLTLVADPEKLQSAVEIAEEIAPFVTEALLDEDMRQSAQRRALRAELLYQLSTLSQGATTANHLASRIVGELSEMLGVERIAVYWVDQAAPILAAHSGDSLDALSELSFGAGAGLKAWLVQRGPEVWIPDTLVDSRISKDIALKKRIRSLAILPIRMDAAPYGFVCVSSPRSCAVDVENMETLRLAVANFGQALARLQGNPTLTEGLATSQEFQEAIRNSPDAAIVQLEPVRKQALIETHGVPAFDQAIRVYASQLRTRLPRGGCIRRQPEGGFLVLLPKHARQVAESWANEVAAMASFIGVPLEGSGTRIPLAFRAKVGNLNEAQEETAGV